MIHLEGETMPRIDEKRHREDVFDVDNAPSIAPYRDGEVESTMPATSPPLRPRYHVAVERAQRVRMSQRSIMGIAKNMVSVAGMIAGLGVYLVVILGVMAASVVWMPFSRADS